MLIDDDSENFIFSLDEFENFSKNFGSNLRNGDVVLLFGDLGAGKTTFVRWAVEGLLGAEVGAMVSSPTFSYVNVYENVCHCDFYNMKSKQEFIDRFTEYFDKDFITFVEWPEKIIEFLLSWTVKITICHLDDGFRKVVVEYSD